MELLWATKGKNLHKHKQLPPRDVVNLSCCPMFEKWNPSKKKEQILHFWKLQEGKVRFFQFLEKYEKGKYSFLTFEKVQQGKLRFFNFWKSAKRKSKPFCLLSTEKWMNNYSSFKWIMSILGIGTNTRSIWNTKLSNDTKSKTTLFATKWVRLIQLS